MKSPREGQNPVALTEEQTGGLCICKDSFDVSNSMVGMLSSATSKVLSRDPSPKIQTFTFLSHLSQQFPGKLISFVNTAKLFLPGHGINL